MLPKEKEEGRESSEMAGLTTVSQASVLTPCFIPRKRRELVIKTKFIREVVWELDMVLLGLREMPAPFLLCLTTVLAIK